MYPLTHFQIKHSIFIFIFCFYSSISFCQNESNNWYFGRKAGLNFNTSPPTALLDGEISTREGVASISDSNGQLLFYTDGRKVWNKNHNVTPNGAGLTGDSSSTQSAVIVPKPNDSNMYYIFTVDKQGGSDGLRYSEFDLTLNNGDGDITGVKNIELWTPTAEKITATEHLNGVNYWIIAHGWGSDSFLVYEITPNGLNTVPIIQNVGAIHQGGFSAIGYMKSSPNGQKLALARWSTNSSVEVFDFDNSSGIISNPILIENIFYQGIYGGAYGVEFSPNSKLLYVSDLASNMNANSRVHQFNIELQNQTEILNSDILLYDGDDFIGAIQSAKDGKLYLANENQPFLDIIEYPNIIGNAANYLNREISLGGRDARIGLPTFIQSFFYNIIEYENFCSGSETSFSLGSNQEIISTSWDFGDGTTSNSINPAHIYISSGTYTVTVNINFMNQVSRTATREIIIHETPIANFVSNFELCDDSTNNQIETFDLSSKISEVMGGQSDQIFDVAFYESLDSAENDQNRLALTYTNNTNGQEVFVKIYNAQYERCYAITSFLLKVNPQPIAHSIDDVSLCDDQSNDGSVLLELNQFNTAILQDQSTTDSNITYHLSQNEADTNSNPLSNNFSTISNPQSLFVRVESQENSECYDTTQFSIFINEALTVSQVQDLYKCEDTINSDIATFDLTVQTDQILANLTGTYNINYFQSEQDANMNVNSIGSSYMNITNPELLYARVQDVNSESCFDVIDFNVHVLAVPDIVENETLYLCTDESITLSADSGFDYYLWSTGENYQSITVNMSGTYTVEIGNTYNFNAVQNCTTTKTFNVIESGAATNIEIDFGDWTSNQNTILVLVDGLGDYEYSLNGVDYSELNLFENLTPGEYTVYVRDKNNCGVATQFVFLLNYPHFFTPNNDGINDYWQVILSKKEPRLKISIYDRYGKRLTSINPLSEGWDGNYNGRPMPSGDYWFKVERPSTGRVYKGHFTLKR